MKKEIITICGGLGSGKSSTAKRVAKELGYRHFSSGDFFRQVGLEMGLSINEINKRAETEPEIDKRTDEKLRSMRNESKVGNTTTDISRAIENFVKQHKYGIVEVLSGHGVGRAIHEDPYIPNFVGKNPGVKLRASMVIAIEPMLNEGGKDVVLERDGYTFRTKDGKRSVHFEHTVLVTDTGPEILTQL